MFDLIIQTGKHRGTRLSLPLDKPIVVGRDEACQMTLASSLVSRRHCELTHTALGIRVCDLQSQNGTYINDVVVEIPTVMQVGDQLRIGASVFEMQPALSRTPAKKGETAQAPTDAPASAPSKSGRSQAAKGLSSGQISDDDISDWLSDDTATDLRAASSGDTTIIQGRERPPAAAVKPPSSSPAPAPATPAPAHRAFKSVKEEAAEIIRRHWQKIRGE